jgi:hypothetical protein
MRPAFGGRKVNAVMWVKVPEAVGKMKYCRWAAVRRRRAGVLIDGIRRGAHFAGRFLHALCHR